MSEESTELAVTSDESPLKALKMKQKARSTPKAHCHKSPKQCIPSPDIYDVTDMSYGKVKI